MKISAEVIAELSKKLEGFIEMEAGEKLPYVSLLLFPNGQMGVFTNRRSDLEVRGEKADRENPLLHQ